ncbi:unnamed protein product, partial [Symbiodinium pilosum]
VPFVPAISEEEVQAVQTAWANAIKTISKTYLSGGDYVAEAAKAAGELYGYGHTNVLFKPTKAGVDLKGIITYRSGFHFLVRYPYITLYYPHVTLYNI